MSDAALAGIGHNEPPEPTPFEASAQEINDLYAEAQHWLDGSGIQTKADADAIGKLMSLLRTAAATADERRKIEAAPFDEAKAAIQTKYAPLIADTKSAKGKATIAIDLCKQTLAPWLKKIEDEQRAEAAKLREKADAERIAAEQAIRASRNQDLNTRELAEEMLTAAKKAEAAANRAADARPQVAGDKRAVGLRTDWIPALIDGVAAARYYWKARRDEMEIFLTDLAERDVRGGRREIPGFEITETKTVV